MERRHEEETVGEVGAHQGKVRGLKVPTTKGGDESADDDEGEERDDAEGVDGE